MPTIKLNKKSLEKSLGKKLTPEKLKDRISYLGTDLEGIEGNNISVEVFPDRPDMLSEQGFARALSSFIGGKTGLRTYKTKSSGKKVIIDASVEKVRPFTVCAIVKNLKLDDNKIKEIIQIQEKLHITYGRNRKKVAIGVYPIEKIKFPIRFMALKPDEIRFQPLDFRELMTGSQILKRHPAGKAYGHLLEGQQLFPIFVDATDQILSMPPIINSHNTGKVEVATKEVFIECSGFDVNVLNKCLNIIAAALADMGGQINTVQLQYPRGKKSITPDLTPEEMKVDLTYVNKLLGLELKDVDFKRCLAKMGYGFEKGKVLIPAYRADVLHPVDVAEDIAIAYGYDKFQEKIPNVATVGQEDKFEVFKRKIAEIMVGLGFLETHTFCLTNEEALCTKMNADLDYIELANSVNQEYGVLRSWMIPNLLEVLSSNKHHEYPQNVFEMGHIFKKNPKTETGIGEAIRLGALMCKQDADYTDIKQVLDALLRSLGVEYDISEVEHPSFIIGRIARVSVKGKGIAFMGEIHPEILSNFALPMPVAAFELNLTDLFDIITS